MATAGHYLPPSTGAAARPSHRPPTPSLYRPPSPVRARSPAPSSSSSSSSSSAAAFASTSKPIPIKEPPSYFARPPRISGPLLAPLTTRTGGIVTDPASGAPTTREATLAEAIRHNDLRALVQNQERARSLARTPRPPSSKQSIRGASRSRSRVTIPSLGGTLDGEEAGSESSGETVHIPILNLRGQTSDSTSSRAADNATGTVRAGSSSMSPSPGSTSRLPPSSKRRLSCLANYTGILPGQQQQLEQQYPPPPVRSMSARAPSPELRYSLSFADRRVSAPPTARPLMTRRFSSSNDTGSGGANARPPSPAPPGFKTSSRRGSGGGGIDGFSPLLPAMKGGTSPSTTVVGSNTPRRRASVSNVPARARSPSPSVSVTPSSSAAIAHGLVRAASPSPRVPPVKRSPSTSPSLAAAASLARGSSHDRARAGSGGPLVVRGFDAPASSAAAAGRQIGGGGRHPPSPSSVASSRTTRSMLQSIKKPPGVDNGAGITSMKSSAGPITRPRSSLVDRTADQRLEIRASRDFERIDEYYSARYAAAAAAAAAVDAQRAESEAATASSLRQQLTGSASGRERRAEKRLAEERLRRGYDRMA